MLLKIVYAATPILLLFVGVLSVCLPLLLQPFNLQYIYPISVYLEPSVTTPVPPHNISDYAYLYSSVLFLSLPFYKISFVCVIV